MGNTSHTLQSGTRSKVTKQAPSRTPAASKPRPFRSSSRLLLHFAQRHPFFCLFAVWGAFIYFGWLAVTGLAYTNPDPIEPPKPEVVAEAPKPFRIDTPATSFGLLAIVAGSCAVTSVLLARQLRPARSSQRTLKRVIVQSKPVKSRSTSSSRRPPMPIQQANMPAPPTRRTATTAKPALPPVVRRPVTTVLPPEQDSPLEMRDPSLAEMMDIRRQA